MASALHPLLMMAVLVLIFGRIVNLDISHYPAFVLSALLPWTFFSMGMTNAAISLSRAAGLVKRVRIALVTSAITLVAGVVVVRRLDPHFDDYI